MAQNNITAVAFRGNLVEWTTVKTVKGRVEVLEHKSAELPGGAEVLTSEEFAGAVKATLGHVKGQLYVAIPSERALLRVVDLPTTDPDEMAGMVELQVDKFSPFPVEHMGVSFESFGQHENTSRVLIGAVQNEIINAVGDAFRQCKLLPHWIDIDVMGWWRLLVDASEVPAQGRCVTLVLDTGGAELMISENGVPLVIRSLGTPAGVSAQEYYEEIAEEVGYTLTTLEAERGMASDVRITLWHRGQAGATKSEMPPKAKPPGAPPADESAFPALVSRLVEVCGAEVQTRKLDELPPLSEGLARRAANRRGQLLDLAPAEWHSEEQSRALKKTLIIATAVFLVLWLGGLSAFVAGLTIEKKKLEEKKNRVDALEGPAEELRELQDKIRSFEEYADRSHSALEALREITVKLPGGVDLMSFTYKKADEVNVRGLADRPDPIYDFFQGLEQSTFFTKIDPGNVRSRVIKGAQKSEFSVTATLPSEDEEANL